MIWWQIVLFPFAIIYDIVTRIRNWAYDVRLLRSDHFPQVRTVAVGNLSVGGTGKTPMVEYLVRWALEAGVPVAILSRGYGRKTRGLVVADENATAEQIGDEPMGYRVLFGDRVPVVLAEKRREGIQKIIAEFPEIRLVILDDAFQHRQLHADAYVLLTTYQRPFWRDFLLPVGRLRESRRGVKRADALVVTKCPGSASLTFPEWLPAHLALGSTGITYDELKMVNGHASARAIAVAGLADNSLFFNYLKENFEIVSEHSFPDHAEYTQAVIMDLVQEAKAESAMLVCTQKDAVKWMPLLGSSSVSWGYIPIRTSFLSGERDFQKKLAPFIHPSADTHG